MLTFTQILALTGISLQLAPADALIGICPCQSHGYLAADNSTQQGTINTCSDTLTFYESGYQNSTKAAIIIPDVYGWNSGRTRNIADYLADNGFYTMVPKILQPPIDGGTDGDGVRGDFDLGSRFPELAALLKKVDWNTYLKSRIGQAVERIESFGIRKIGIVGFCFGGWVVSQAIADFPANFSAGVTAHPSITIEQMVYGRNTTALIARAKKPILWMPSSNEPAEFSEDGALFKVLVKSSPLSKTIRFPRMLHGWVPRGSLDDPAIKEDAELAVKYIKNFFDIHMFP